jgi:hypothetical protein
MKSDREMLVIDTHAHIVPEAFVEDVRAGKFGPVLSIERGPKWEVLVTRSADPLGCPTVLLLRPGRRPGQGNHGHLQRLFGRTR